MHAASTKRDRRAIHARGEGLVLAELVLATLAARRDAQRPSYTGGARRENDCTGAVGHANLGGTALATRRHRGGSASPNTGWRVDADYVYWWHNGKQDGLDRARQHQRQRRQPEPLIAGRQSPGVAVDDNYIYCVNDRLRAARDRAHQRPLNRHRRLTTTTSSQVSNADGSAGHRGDGRQQLHLLDEQATAGDDRARQHRQRYGRSIRASSQALSSSTARRRRRGDGRQQPRLLDEQVHRRRTGAPTSTASDGRSRASSRTPSLITGWRSTANTSTGRTPSPMGSEAPSARHKRRRSEQRQSELHPGVLMGPGGVAVDALTATCAGRKATIVGTGRPDKLEGNERRRRDRRRGRQRHRRRPQGRRPRLRRRRRRRDPGQGRRRRPAGRGRETTR